MRLGAIFTNSAGILTSRIFGFIRDLLMASVIGANVYSDIFFVAFKLPNLFRRIFAEGAFTQAFLPAFAAARHRGAFAVALLARFTIVLLTFSLAITLASPLITRLIALGFDEKTVALAAPLVAINFYYLDLIFLVTFFAALLQYREHFATTAFSTTLLNLSMIGALLLYRGEEPYRIVTALSWAVLLGGLLQLALHLWMIGRKGWSRLLCVAALQFEQAKKRAAADLRRFNRSFFPAVLGNSTAQIAAFIDTWLASFLAGGAISHLFYANRLFQLPLALFATAAATALFPSITKLLRQNGYKEATERTKEVFWLLAGLLGGATAVALILSQQIVWLLFERGAFDRADRLITADVLQMYILGLLPFGLAKLFSLWLYARHRQKEAAAIAARSLGANILLSLLLIAPMQASGLALASSLAGWIQFYLTVKAAGRPLFLDIMRSKYLFHAAGFVLLCAAAAWALKAATDGYL